MPGTGHGSENTALNWADLCSQSRVETDIEEVSVSVKNIVIEKAESVAQGGGMSS